MDEQAKERARARRDWPVTKARLSEHDQDAEDVRYWLSKTVEERFAALEDLREAAYPGYSRHDRMPRPIKVYIRRLGDPPIEEAADEQE